MTKKERNKLYKLFLYEYLDCYHSYVCDIFTDYYWKQNGKGKFYREDISKRFPEVKLFLIEKNNSCLQFGNQVDWLTDQPKTMGIIFFQLLIEMTN